MTLPPLSAVGITRYHRPGESYTKLRDSFLRNAKITLRAFRVGAYVLSHAEGFIQTQRQIAHAVGLSVTTVRAALEDLEQDRYLVKRRIRQHGQWIGTAYAVSDIPFTEEELAQLCPPGAESECSESVHTGSGAHKKTTPVRETISPRKTNPPGAPSGSAAPASSTEEEPVAPASQPTLDLDLPAAEIAPKQGGKSAATVVAAYVDAYRRNHSGGDPLKRDTGRVARDAAGLLRDGKATVEELVDAATAMGGTPYANLGVQLNMARERGQRRGGKVRGICPPSPAEMFAAGHAEQHAEFIRQLHADPEVAAWVAEDREQVAALIAEDPTLEAVFAAVAA